MSIFFRIVRDNRDFFCTADNGPKFFVGRRVPYESNIGLYNIFSGSQLKKLNYNPANYGAEFGFWADFIDPTAECEGRNFLTLNTYDRAAFTFGFTQFAAHVPDGDFVQYFRALLSEAEAANYFPTLKLIDGRIHKVDGPSPVALESAATTQPLMNYLNPTLHEVEDQEVIGAGKLIHWTTEYRPARLTQIKVMIDAYRGFMRRAATRGLIEGRTADQCCVIADILHHGRGGSITWSLIADAVHSSRPFDNLIAIGAPKWNERKKTLRRKILANANMKTLKWSTAKNDFV